MEDVGAFTAPAHTNSRAVDDDAGHVGVETVELEASYSSSSHCTIKFGGHLQEQLPTHVHTSHSV